MEYTTDRNVLELRGSLLSIIADVESEQVLRQILAHSLKLLRSQTLKQELPPELLAELEDAYAESDDESEAISNEEAFNRFRQWAKQ